jgi:hypothetical protein
MTTNAMMTTAGPSPALLRKAERREARTLTRTRRIPSLPRAARRVAKVVPPELLANSRSANNNESIKHNIFVVIYDNTIKIIYHSFIVG